MTRMPLVLWQMKTLGTCESPFLDPLIVVYCFLCRFDTDKDAFLQKVTQSVEESGRRVYDKQPDNCSLIFTGNNAALCCVFLFIIFASFASEPKPAHEDIIKEILSELRDISTAEEGLNSSAVLADDEDDLGRSDNNKELDE